MATKKKVKNVRKTGWAVLWPQDIWFYPKNMKTRATAGHSRPVVAAVIEYTITK